MQLGKIVSTQVGIRTYGDATCLKTFEIQLQPPGDNEVRLRHTVVGVNYIDVYQRTGLYRLPALPSALGVEAAGVIEELGSQVTDFRVGQRVAYAGLPAGSYSSLRNVPADRLIALPDDVSDESAAALLLRGITAHMLLTHVWPVRPRDNLLLHAAAGGLGLVLVQWAKTLGARVIGTLGSQSKAALVLDLGLDEAILYREVDFVEAARTLTDGRGVDFVVDGIGGANLLRSIQATRAFGLVASVGQVSGDGQDADRSLLELAPGVAVSRPSVISYMRDLQRYRDSAHATIERLRAGLRVHIDSEFPLEDTAGAHRRLESRSSVGSILLRP